MRDLGNWFRVLTSGLVTAGCAGTMQAPGGTIADATLQGDVMRYIALFEGARGGMCSQWKLANTEVTEGNPPGNWVERWTVDRCGQSIRYRVTYMPSPQGGTTLGVGEER